MPAAGDSRRMGAPKLLLPFGGGTMVEASVAAALEACARVVLVVGSAAERIRPLFSGEPRVLIVENPRWELGMFSSLQRGMEAVETPRFFVSLADMPLVRPGVYRALLAAPRAEAAFPVFSGRRGHPVLLGPAARKAALAEDPASGSMKAIISAFPVSEVPWDDDSILADVDTPGDYARRISS